MYFVSNHQLELGATTALSNRYYIWFSPTQHWMIGTTLFSDVFVFFKHNSTEYSPTKFFSKSLLKLKVSMSNVYYRFRNKARFMDEPITNNEFLWGN